MNNSLFDLTGKIALVTGSGQGIGLALARGLGKAGATLVLNDIIEDRLVKTVAEVSNEGINVYGFKFDVTDKSETEQKIAEMEAQVGPIDILVNNAGVNLRAPLEQMELSTWQKVLDINLTGVFIASQAVAKGMIDRKSGKIINICSLMSELGRATTGPYTATKGAVKMLTKAMCVEWAKHNIQINGIGPGYILTDMTKVLSDDEKFDSWIKARTPAARWGHPSELVGTAVFLASSAGDFVNGQVVYVDGGFLASM